jgi:hypothetical protein
MRRLIYAALLALSALPAAAQNYPPDYSNTEVWDPSLWNPKVVTTDYTLAPGDRVIGINCSTNCVLTLPTCVPGIVIRIINGSPYWVTYSTGTYPTTLTGVQVALANGDQWISGLSPTSGPYSAPLTINAGAVMKFRAVGWAGACAWVWATD